MVIHPNLNPVFVQLGPLKVHWYGLMYLLGFLIIWGLMNYRLHQFKAISSSTHIEKLNSAHITDLFFFGAMGVIIGGRLGYMIFYDVHHFIHNPLTLLEIWKGGMSFHGGALGVIIMLWWWSKKYHYPFLFITDFVTPMVPVGIATGRIGNFINGELWGKVTSLSWGMIYPHIDSLPRHPSELYEFLFEGVLLFIVLWVYSSKPRPRLAVSALFLLGYGCARCFCEFFRQPDPQYGYLAFNWLTMGQLLSLPMILLGGLFLYIAYHSKDLNT